jgi:hypothetical protein
MKKVLIVLFLGFSSFVVAQQLQVSGYGSMSIPIEKDKKFVYDWMRVRIEAPVSDSKEFSIAVEHDVYYNKIQDAYIRYTNKTLLENTTMFVSAGRFLNPALWPFDGPKGLELSRFPIVTETLVPKVEGLEVGIKTVSGYGTRIAVFERNNKKEVSGNIETPYVSLFLISDIGYGVTTRFSKDVYTFIVGATKEKGRNIAFSQLKVEVTNFLHAWLEYDVSSLSSPYYISGVTVVYQKNSFLKLFWDGQTEVATAKITFAF